MHVPVLSNEVIEQLAPKSGGRYIDCTLNGGGHAEKILEASAPDGRVLGIEIDREICEAAVVKFKNYGDRIKIIRDSYARLADIAERERFRNADGILFDLGMSSWHVDESGRGFSFSGAEPLDMRFHADPAVESQLTAADVVNNYSRENLEYILREYGEEQFARKIAQNIVAQREKQKFQNTAQLVEVIGNSVPFWYKTPRRTHFATKTFQALRIEVNQEIKSINKGLQDAIEMLSEGGKMAVISFHSLEDRIIKGYFKKWADDGRGEATVKKPIVPSGEEIRQNRRSRSAKMRVFLKHS